MLTSEAMGNLQSDRTEGFHLFIEPAPPLAEELSSLIKKLAAEYGGPVFPPHVTLIAGIPAGSEEDIAAKARAVAGALAPTRLTLGETGAEDAYFKALYFKIKETEEMNAYHALAKRAFGMEEDDGYMPHLSLLYGNYPRARKEHITRTLPALDRVSFLADRISLYKTEGKPANWQKLGEFALAAA